MAEYRVVMKGDELYHWKYLDKYQKNGKWVYIYDEAKGKVNSGIKSAKASIKRTKKDLNKKINKFEKKAKKQYREFKKDATRTYKSVSKKARQTYNEASSKVTAAYNKAAPKIKAVASKVLSAVKNLIQKGKTLANKALDFLFGTTSTKTTLKNVTRPDATTTKLTGKNRGKGPSSRVVSVKDTTVVNSGVTESIRKGKKAVAKALGKNTNTYRTDRLR